MNHQKRTWLPWLAPILTAGLGLAFLSCPGCSFSAIVCFGFSALLCGYPLLRLLQKKHDFAARALRKVLSALLAAVLLVMGITGSFVISGSGGTKSEESDYVLLLGCLVRPDGPSRTLRERIDKAYAYLQSHPDATCIVTGGKGSDEIMSEAQCMFNELTAMGIAEDRIWMEDNATSTVENLRYSLALIETKTGIRPDHLTIISSETHLFRASLMAKDLGLTAVTVPASTHPLFVRISNGLREIAAIWKYLIIGG